VDGDVTFDVSDSHLVSTGLSACSANSDPFQLQREARAEDFRKAGDSFNPIAGLARQWISAGAALLGTGAAWWMGHLFLTPPQLLQQAMPDVVAVLVFFLVARLR
jgi:hypothetical protein